MGAPFFHFPAGPPPTLEVSGRKRYLVDCVAGAKVIAAMPDLRVRSVKKS